MAGGGPSFGTGRPEVYVYDTMTGQEMVTCVPCTFSGFGAFLNDITIRNGVAYITDSIHGKLMAMDVQDALGGECNVWEVQLPESLHPSYPDDFGANGIVPYEDGLLIVDVLKGAVWYILIDDDSSTSSSSGKSSLGSSSSNSNPEGCYLVTPAASQAIISECPQNANEDYVSDPQCALYGDGLVIQGRRRLFVTQNLLHEIGVFDLRSSKKGTVTAEKVDTLQTNAFNTPTVSAIVMGYIYSTNSRFGDK